MGRTLPWLHDLTPLPSNLDFFCLKYMYFLILILGFQFQTETFHDQIVMI